MNKRRSRGRGAYWRALLASIVCTAFAPAAFSEVCYYKIKSLDWDRLGEIYPEKYELFDPNIKSVGDAQWSIINVVYALTGNFTWTDKRLGYSQTYDVSLVKTPCGPRSVKEIVESYGATFDDRLSYKLEMLTQEQYICSKAANCCLDEAKNPRRCDTSGTVGLWKWPDQPTKR